MNIDALFEQLGWTLLHTTWQGTAVAALLLIALRGMRSASASARYLASCAAMLLIVVSAIATFQRLQPKSIPLASSLAPSRRIAPIALPPLATTSDIPSNQSSHRHVLRNLVIAWIIGVALMSAWHIGGWLRLRALRRGDRCNGFDELISRLIEKLHITRRVLLIQTTSIDVPAVIGVFRPVILIPVGVFTGLPPQQVEAILAHELAHIRRHDYLINLIQAAIESVMFYHPAVWWISSRIRCERENCCDDIAAAACGDAKSYASALAALEHHRGPRCSASLAASATGGDLLARVRRLLNIPAAAPHRSIRSVAAALLAIACVTVPVILAQEKTAPPLAPATAAAADLTIASPIEPTDLKATAEDYRIASNDLVNVSITDLVAAGVETVKSCRVSETGNVTLPLVGAVKLAGLSETEAQAAVAKVYKDKNLIANAQISVSVTEARGRTFSILGSVDRPGQYQIPQSDFRILDALAMSGGRPGDASTLNVIRAASSTSRKRVLEIPLDRLAAGDLGVNVVIRPGDMLIAKPREKKFVKVVIGKQTLLYQDKPTDMPALHKLFGDMPESERHNTVLEIAAAAPDVTVERFFAASAQLSQIVEQYKLAYLSETGILPTTEPAAAQKKVSGEYYINGKVQRTGVYSLSGREINVKQAIAAAGGFDNGAADGFISLLRREGKSSERWVMQNVLYSDLLAGRHADEFLQPNDIIRVSDKRMETPKPATTQAQAQDDSERIGMARLLDSLAIQRAEMMGRYGEKHPKVQQANSMFNEVQRKLADYDKHVADARAQATVDQIAAVDPMMRQYVDSLDRCQLQLAQYESTLGPRHRLVVSAKQQVETLKQRIDAYAEKYRHQSAASQPVN